MNPVELEPEFTPFPWSWQQRHVLMPAMRLVGRYFRARIHGRDNVPTDRPVVLVSKHPRGYLYLETLLLALLTYCDRSRPPFHAMEKRGTSLHRTPLLSWIRRHASTLPATEGAARASLAAGESVLIFPGGARELYGPPDQLRWKGRIGFARIAAEAGVPIIPVAMVGADQQHPLRLPLGQRGSLWLPLLPLPVPLDFHFGAPIPPPPEATDESIAALALRATEATQALLDAGVAARRPAWGLP
jgi:1-acyl-sn-glycerol-3-phosphate acyltransferase